MGDKKLSIAELEQMARYVRRDIIQMIHEAQAGHPGGSLSAADIVTALYFRIMRIDPANPDWADRDRFIMSKGHGCPAWYSALIERGYLPRDSVHTLRKLDSALQGHPDMRKTRGLDMSTGSLGQGLSVGLGMALGARLLGKTFRVYVLLGDGELQEGQPWEAIMAASRWRLDKLTAIVDDNGLQNDAPVGSIMPLRPIADKFRAFGWHAVDIDGHNMKQIVDTLESLVLATDRPTAIIARTVKGKGVSFMENVAGWHGRAPTKEEYEQALAEIGEVANA